VHAIKLGVSTRANHEIGPRATGPATRLDTAGRLYADNASKMASACTETQAGRVSGKNTAAEATVHAIKLGVSTRANHEIGPQATGPVTRLDTAGRLYAENASKIPEPAQKRRRGGSVERTLRLRRRGTLLNWE